MKYILSVCNCNCDAEIINLNVVDEMKTIIKYPHCGQKIDWGEKDCSDCASRLKTWLEQEHESSFSEEEKLMLESLKRRSYSFIVYYSDYGEAWAYECYPDLNSRWDRARGHKELRLLEGMFETLKSNKVYRVEDLLER